MPKALITGASSGIGECIAKELSEKGYETVLVARDTEKLKKLRKKLGAESFIETVDLADMEGVARLYSRHTDIDVLVNCAGLGIFGEFEKSDFQEECNMLDVNIKALQLLMKKYLPEMKRRGGKILNVASSAAFFPGPIFSSYYASKAYVYRLSLAVREELRREKAPVTISVFCPGPVKTPFNEKVGVNAGMGAITPEYAAKCAVNGMLKGKAVITPGIINKASRLFSGFLPDTFYAKIVYSLQRAKQKQGGNEK